MQPNLDPRCHIVESRMDYDLILAEDADIRALLQVETTADGQVICKGMLHADEDRISREHFE